MGPTSRARPHPQLRRRHLFRELPHLEIRHATRRRARRRRQKHPRGRKPKTLRRRRGIHQRQRNKHETPKLPLAKRPTFERAREMDVDDYRVWIGGVCFGGYD